MLSLFAVDFLFTGCISVYTIKGVTIIVRSNALSILLYCVGSDEFARLIADKAHLEAVMKAGAEEAAYYARKTMSKVKRKIGFVG